MLIKAKLNYLRIAPRKTRLVGNLIRGKSLKEAERLLIFTYKRAAAPFLKLLKSAAANVKNNFHLTENNLYIKELRIDEAPVLKRRMPRARGRATLIRKKGSHITLVLEEQAKLKVKSEK